MSCNKPRSAANTPLANCNTRPSSPPRDQGREVARRRAGRTGAGQGQRPVHLRRAGIPADRALNRPSGELLAVARPASDGIMVRGRFFSYDKRMQCSRGRDAAVFAHRNRPPRPHAPRALAVPKGRFILGRPCDEKSPQGMTPVREYASRGARSAPYPAIQLKNSFTRSVQDLLCGEWRSPPSFSEASNWRRMFFCSSLRRTGVSTTTWQYRSPG